VKKVCCVCGKDLGEVPGPPSRLTHGFCESCYRDQLRALEALPAAATEAVDPCRASDPGQSTD